MFRLHCSLEESLFYATTDSAGFDLRSSIDCLLEAGEWVLVPTGMRIIEALPAPQFLLGERQSGRVLAELQIRPRSGLAAKNGITVLNAPSTIDADYRGEIMVTLINHSKKAFSIKRHDRIAQCICSLAVQIPGLEVQKVDRGIGGFGSSGV